MFYHKGNFPEKTLVFPPGQKIGTIFWEQTFMFVTPKGPFKFREALL
jgi:hypothetical protein